MKHSSSTTATLVMPSHRILIDHLTIQKAVQEAAHSLARGYRNRETTIVPILNGGMFFGADLARCFLSQGVNANISTMQLSSYGKNRQSSGHAEIVFQPDPQLITNCDVIVAEDVIDTGVTSRYVYESLGDLGPKSIRFIFVVQKGVHNLPKELAEHTTILFPGVSKNHFLFGYGMDLEGKFRALRDICHIID